MDWSAIGRYQCYVWLMIVVIAAALTAPERNGENSFLTEANLRDVASRASITGIVAIGLTLIVLSGAIDLSAGAVVTLGSVGTAWFLMDQGYGLLPTIAATLALGTGIGLANGIVSTGFRLPPYIVTLATLGIAQGAATVWADGETIAVRFGTNPGEAPIAFRDFFGSRVELPGRDVPIAVYYLVGIWLLAVILVHHTRFGRHVVATGGNEIAARLAGVAVARVRIVVFTLAGLLAGLAALLQVGFARQASPADGNALLLSALAAVVIGGTSLRGGAGSLTGTVAGVLIVQILANVLVLRDIDPGYHLVLIGFILLVALLLQRRPEPA